MRVSMLDDSEYIVFLGDTQVKEAFEADEETGRVWVADEETFEGYTVLTGDVRIVKRTEPQRHTITGILINNGTTFMLAEPILAKTGDTITLTINVTNNGGVIDSVGFIEA